MAPFFAVLIFFSYHKSPVKNARQFSAGLFLFSDNSFILRRSNQFFQHCHRLSIPQR